VIRGAVSRIGLGRPRGHEQSGTRLGLVLSPSDSPLSVVTVIPTSTSAGASVHRPELDIAGQPTRLLVDQIRSIDTDYVVGDPVDYLTQDQLAGVELALVHYLGVHHAASPRSSWST
jgi:mRNA interferase MazF